MFRTIPNPFPRVLARADRERLAAVRIAVAHILAGR